MRGAWLALLLVAAPCVARGAQGPDEVRAVLAAWGWAGEWAQSCAERESGIVLARVAGTGSEYPVTAVLRKGRVLSVAITHVAELTAGRELQASAEGPFPTGSMATTALLHREGRLSWAVESRFTLTASVVVAPHTVPFAPDGLQPGQSVTVTVIDHGLAREPGGRVTGVAPVLELCGPVTEEERRLVAAAREPARTRP